MVGRCWNFTSLVDGTTIVSAHLFRDDNITLTYISKSLLTLLFIFELDNKLQLPFFLCFPHSWMWYVERHNLSIRTSSNHLHSTGTAVQGQAPLHRLFRHSKQLNLPLSPLLSTKEKKMYIICSSQFLKKHIYWLTMGNIISHMNACSGSPQNALHFH
jgi:hypothetical protein